AYQPVDRWVISGSAKHRETEIQGESSGCGADTTVLQNRQWNAIPHLSTLWIIARACAQPVFISVSLELIRYGRRYRADRPARGHMYGPISGGAIHRHVLSTYAHALLRLRF